MVEIFQKKVNELKWLYMEKLMVEIQTGVRGGFLEIQWWIFKAFDSAHQLVSRQSGCTVFGLFLLISLAFHILIFLLIENCSSDFGLLLKIDFKLYFNV